MNAIKDVHDFKLFLKDNREKIYENTINASDISSQDEWRMDRKIRNLSESDFRKFMQLTAEFLTNTYMNFLWLQ